MGYGPTKNGKQKPITPWQGSWAESMSQPRTSDRKLCGLPTPPRPQLPEVLPRADGRTNARLP